MRQRAAELGQALRQAPKDSSASVACEGLVYCFIHGLLGRRVRSLSFDAAEFLLAAASAEDHELRALAGLALGCLGQSPQRGIGELKLARNLADLCCMPEGISAAQRTRRLEATAALLGATSMRHHFSLLGEAEGLCQGALITMLQDERVEVRLAGQNALAPLLGLEDSQVCKARVKTFATLGPGDSVDTAVHGLGALLNAASSLGAPPWLGAVIEALAKVGRRPEAKKEVERMVQAFLKQQQQSRDIWKRCQTRLSKNQLELLESGRGTLSYYS